MNTETLLQMAREGDGTFRLSRNTVIFDHVDGRSWTIRLDSPREARGWLHLSTV